MSVQIESPYDLLLVIDEHIYSPTRQKDRQRQIIYSGIKHIVNSNYTVTLFSKASQTLLTASPLDKNKVQSTQSLLKLCKKNIKTHHIKIRHNCAIKLQLPSAFSPAT